MITVLLKTEISLIQKKVDELNYHNDVKEINMNDVNVKNTDVWTNLSPAQNPSINMWLKRTWKSCASSNHKGGLISEGILTLVPLPANN